MTQVKGARVEGLQVVHDVFDLSDVFDVFDVSDVFDKQKTGERRKGQTRD